MDPIAAHPPVLVVDDDLDYLTVLSTVMQLEGYAVQTAANGRAALAHMGGAATPLLVLLDLRMPQPNGVAILEAVAADTDLAQRCAIIIVTGAREDAMYGHVRDLRTQLAIPVVLKPFDVWHLFEVIAEAEQRLAS